MSDYGIKATIPGKAITSTNPRDYSIWSKYDLMKTFIVGKYEYTFPSDLPYVEIDIPHDLGYRPAIWVSYKCDSNPQWRNWNSWSYWYTTGNFPNIDGALRSWICLSFSDKIQFIYFEDNEFNAGFDPTGEHWTFRYYMFLNEII